MKRLLSIGCLSLVLAGAFLSVGCESVEDLPVNPGDPAPPPVQIVYEITWDSRHGVEPFQARRVITYDHYLYFEDLETGKPGWIYGDVMVRQK